MSNYIRRRTPGATYIFTLRLAQRHDDLLLRRIDHLRRCMRATLERYPFRIDAITVLPATIHMLCTLPPDDDAYPARIALLKSQFSRGCPMPPHRTLSQIKRAEKGIWQRRYWEHAIQDAADFDRHRDLIYLSPVHAGLCPRPQDWPHTSLHRDLRRGAPIPPAFGFDRGTPQLAGNTTLSRQNEKTRELLEEQRLS
ncbi:transposase [Sulfitobacter noctilucicola]|uniref:Putative transposase n=1 Tax=Sulfitobacter noctilucicola TaxID=1342301 RepID=A0A7W6M867_9RHOB|nr:transposase [Sulfitobacter noctilucicola]KIN64629.1 transposase [Sulfitobacter noctilucicola]MBB4174221.1 putative transposase [Sulfitobacter noctilucicola]